MQRTCNKFLVAEYITILGQKTDLLKYTNKNYKPIKYRSIWKWNT